MLPKIGLTTLAEMRNPYEVFHPHNDTYIQTADIYLKATLTKITISALARTLLPSSKLDQRVTAVTRAPYAALRLADLEHLLWLLLFEAMALIAAGEVARKTPPDTCIPADDHRLAEASHNPSRRQSILVTGTSETTMRHPQHQNKAVADQAFFRQQCKG